GSPFCGGLISAGLLKFDSWAHLPELDPLFERVALWTLTDVWEPPAVIQNKGGSPRMGRDPQNISSHLRLMAREFQRTGPLISLPIPRRSILEGFGRDDRSFGTRDTGLVFNYLPWFLRTLGAIGNPQEDPELELKAARAQLSAARGEEYPVTFILTNLGRS